MKMLKSSTRGKWVSIYMIVVAHLATALAEDVHNFETLTVPLVHRDTLAFDTTPDGLFKLRLQRDAARLKGLTAMSAVQDTTRHVHGTDFSSPVKSGDGDYLGRGFSAEFGKLSTVPSSSRPSISVLDG